RGKDNKEEQWNRFEPCWGDQTGIQHAGFRYTGVMLVKQGRVRSAQVDRRLGWTLAAIAGALNTTAFHAVGFFAANMTGNVSLASDNAAVGAWASALFFLAILLLFVLGAAVATLLTSAGLRHEIAGIYALGVLLESMLLAVVWLLCLRLPAA